MASPASCLCAAPFSVQGVGLVLGHGDVFDLMCEENSPAVLS